MTCVAISGRTIPTRGPGPPWAARSFLCGRGAGQRFLPQIHVYVMTGAKYSVTRCSFGSLAASLAGTLREPCGNLAGTLRSASKISIRTQYKHVVQGFLDTRHMYVYNMYH